MIDPAARAANAEELLRAVIAGAPARLATRAACATVPAAPLRDLFGGTPAPRAKERKTKTEDASQPAEEEEHRRDLGPVSELAYEAAPPCGDASTAGPCAPWKPGVVSVAGAVAHPTPLVQSAAMAAVEHPKPSHRPLLPERVVTEGLLSDAQIESVVLAGEAHNRHLSARYRIGAGWETVRRCTEESDEIGVDAATTEDGEALSAQVRFRRGWMLGDGTGCGKGRQVSAVMLDNRLRGRGRALWLSASANLLEDARRDWAALGGREEDVIPLGDFRQGADIPQDEGILFATYATLRAPAREGKASRLDQVVAWLAGSLEEEDRHGFSGVIVFDESHAMANAAGSRGSRGKVKPSAQGRAGLRLQNALPDARVLYVSATGATTVTGLAYAVRLGLWGAGETPFENRGDFVSAMEAGGVAAMEVVARDLKALGLYQARALSYEGIEVDILEHPLTPEQRRIYDAYAGAFKVIHANLQDALEATGIMQGEETLNKNAKSAALSAFEGAKQRFFGHLLCAMKCPSLIRAVEADLDAGRSAVIQLVSTGEALMERRVAEIPPSEWDDLSIDLTPREYVLDFPGARLPGSVTGALHRRGGEPHEPARRRCGREPRALPGGSRQARGADRETGFPPARAVTALDQIVHHFGHDAVAEVTGRSRRVLRIEDAQGVRLALAPASGLGRTSPRRRPSWKVRSASSSSPWPGARVAQLPRRPRVCANTQRRVHYLLEPGWRADQAIQGLGRTHRTHQAISAPVPARHHQRERRAALYRHHREETRFPGRHHTGAAELADRHGWRGDALPRRRQPRKPLRPGGAPPVLRRLVAGRCPRLVAHALRGGDRSQAYVRGSAERRPPAHAEVP